MSMIVYGGSLSPYVARVAIAARYKGMKYALTPAVGGGQKSPEFLKIHPYGKVPALKDGKTVLFESTVIVEYLEAKGKTKKLVPKAAKAAAQTRLVGTVAVEYVQGAVSKLSPFFRGPPSDPEILDSIGVDINKALDALETVMPKSKYAAGAKFSLADVYVGPTLHFASMMTVKFGLGDLVSRRPRLKKYLAAMFKDKAAGDVLKGMTAEWKRLGL